MGTTTTPGDPRGGIGDCAPQEKVAGADSGPDERREPPLAVKPAGEARIEMGELRLVLIVPPFPLPLTVCCDCKLEWAPDFLRLRTRILKIL